MMKRHDFGTRLILMAGLLVFSLTPVRAAGQFDNGHGPAAPQEKFPPREEIRNLKIAFFADRLQLTPEQSEKFWPLYNEYWNARLKIGHRRQELHRSIREGRAGEQQLKELLEVMDAERQVAADYVVRFRRILPLDKVAKVFVADEDFKNFLIRKAASGGGGNGGGRR